MYSDMTVTGEARRGERGRGETQPGQWVGACFQKKCRRPSEAICVRCFLYVSFWLDFSHDLSGGGFFVFCLFLLVEPRRMGEREREKNGWVASEPDDGRQVNRSFPLLVGFLFSVLFLFLWTKILYQVDEIFLNGFFSLRSVRHSQDWLFSFLSACYIHEILLCTTIPRLTSSSHLQTCRV